MIFYYVFPKIIFLVIIKESTPIKIYPLLIFSHEALKIKINNGDLFVKLRLHI
jgi:hypothetical protein